MGERKSGSHKRSRGPSRDDLSIRWFTPRGRAVVRELVEDLRHGGEHALEITAELRRIGVDEGVLDLRGINLRGMDLAGANLADADLRGSRLDRTNLRGACLDRAQLDWSSLSSAKLRGASLKGAFVRYAKLTGTDLTEANLEGVSLDGSLLKETILRRTFMKDVDTSVATLEDVSVSQILRRRHKPTATTRHRYDLGAPPSSEPRRSGKTNRFKTHMGLKRPRQPAPPLAKRPARDFEHAIAELLLDRDRVGRITAMIDGEQVVIYEGQATRTLRLA